MDIIENELDKLKLQPNKISMTSKNNLLNLNRKNMNVYDEIKKLNYKY
jgi:hypothetical protein